MEGELATRIPNILWKWQTRYVCLCEKCAKSASAADSSSRVTLRAYYIDICQQCRKLRQNFAQRKRGHSLRANDSQKHSTVSGNQEDLTESSCETCYRSAPKSHSDAMMHEWKDTIALNVSTSDCRQVDAPNVNNIKHVTNSPIDLKMSDFSPTNVYIVRDFCQQCEVTHVRNIKETESGTHSTKRHSHDNINSRSLQPNDRTTEESYNNDSCSCCSSLNCEEEAPWLPICFEGSTNSDHPSSELLGCYKIYSAEKKVTEQNDTSVPIVINQTHYLHCHLCHTDIAMSINTQTLNLSCNPCHTDTPKTLDTKFDRKVCDHNHTSNVEDSNSGTQDDDDDTCSYPNCDQPAEWWPFCYKHSPDSGYAPGALLDCYAKYMAGKIVDSQQACEANQNNTPAIVESRPEEKTCDPSLTGDCGPEESDDDDSCYYPGCEEPAVWWPYCYRHSPDSGYAPGALLDCHEKYKSEQKQASALIQDQISCVDASDVVDNSTVGQAVDSNLSDEEDDDHCMYPGCERSAVLWPFCYEHSPDSGHAPGALLDCAKKYQESLSDTLQTS